MGFYLRKSISVGPFRFNLSKSGIGVSAGVKGLRFGAGPRGNYVHMGRGGVYYRAAIPSSSTPSEPQHCLPQPLEQQIPDATHAPLVEIESADVAQIVDSSSRELLDELNKKKKIIRIWPIVAGLSGVVLLVGLLAKWPAWLLLFLLIAATIGAFFAYRRDAIAKTVVLIYDFDAEMENAYSQLHGCAERLAGCASAWHIEAKGAVHDRKYHAGASSLVNRNKTSIRKAAPPYVKTNIETIVIGVGKQNLHFFPDRVLIYDSNGVGAVGYQELRINIEPSRFIESGTVPSDAQVVDKTWEYVNKSGGPDRRFKNNRELPICLYEQISLISQTGLNEVVQVSKCGIGKEFAEAIKFLSNKVPKSISPA